MRAVDLFCGAGGASLGLHCAGYDVHGFDHWQPAVDTHNANGLPATLLDLSTDDPPGSCDLLWASPPCQPFSAAGKGDGEFDGRDGFPWLLRILGRMEPRPAVVLVENVKGLTFEKHSAYFGGVLEGIRALGYEVDWRVLNAADYGVPQTRERCIIVARRDGGPITWPAPTHTEVEGLFTERWVTMAEALDVDGIALEPGGGGYHSRNRRAYGPHEPAPSIAFGNDAGLWRWRPAPTASPGKTGNGDLWHGFGRDMPRLTVDEAAAIQGFPAGWRWCGSMTARYKQVGNAVPPALAEAVARANRPVAVAS